MKETKSRPVKIYLGGTGPDLIYLKGESIPSGCREVYSVGSELEARRLIDKVKRGYLMGVQPGVLFDRLNREHTQMVAANECDCRGVLKLWGGNAFWHEGSTDRAGQRRCLVAATSKKRAVELINLAGPSMSMGYFRGYFTETGNTRELECLKSGEGVWLWPDTNMHRGNELVRMLIP